MNKQEFKIFGKKVFLLGKDKEGIKYFLEEARFDCGWYWGFGYVETYTNNKNPNLSKNIASHQHFDSLIFNHNVSCFDRFKNLFCETPLNDKEIWKLCELMKTYYIIKNYSGLLHCGGAHITKNDEKNEILNQDEYNRINKSVLPAIFNAVYKILKPIED